MRQRSSAGLIWTMARWVIAGVSKSGPIAWRHSFNWVTVPNPVHMAARLSHPTRPAAGPIASRRTENGGTTKVGISPRPGIVVVGILANS